MEFHNNTDLPINVSSWKRRPSGLSEYKNDIVLPRTQRTVSSDVGEWIIGSQFFEKEYDDAWAKEGLEQYGRLAKFRNTPCANGNYIWNFSKKDFLLEYVDGAIIWSRVSKDITISQYCFESDINYSDEPSETYDDDHYLSASSITLCSLFDETLQIINRIHISDNYQGDIDDFHTNYGPLGCRDCQTRGSYNGVFFELCQTCAELPDLIDDTDISRDNDHIIIGLRDLDLDSIPDSNPDTDDLNETRYINDDSILNYSDENHIHNMIENFRMPYSSTIQLNIGTGGYRTPSENTIDCIVCQIEKQYHAFMTFQCGHQFCGDCSISWLRTHQTCPLCRNNVQSVNI